jgi:hypothetical protein
MSACDLRNPDNGLVFAGLGKNEMAQAGVRVCNCSPNRGKRK